MLFFFYSLEPMFPIVQFEKYLFKKKNGWEKLVVSKRDKDGRLGEIGEGTNFQL